MRSSLDGRIAGYGIIRAFVEQDEVWKDQKCYNIRFPKSSKHNSEVTIWHMTKEEMDVYFNRK